MFEMLLIRSNRSRIVLSLIFTVGFIVLMNFIVQQSFADSLTSGNLLISTEGSIYEYSTEGYLIQSFSVPYPIVPKPITESLRDIVAPSPDEIFAYNGTFDPYLSLFDIVSETWTHLTHSGWDTVNNVSYGGIAVKDHFVFVTDMMDANGVIRYDLTNNDSIRFANGIDSIDLNVGLDGLLYVLSPGGSPEGRTVHVFDPYTLENIRILDLTATFGWTGHRSIAVNASGDIFVADWDGDLQKINSNGELLLTVNLYSICDCHNLFDVDISADGLVVVSNRFGRVVITDEDFSSFTYFDVGTMGVFVSFVLGTPDTITATINFDPDNLKISKKENFVTVYIELPEGYNVEDIIISSILLEESVPAELSNYAIGDEDNDGIQDLMVKFKRDDVINILPAGNNVPVQITGLMGISPFYGEDYIKVIKR